MDCNASQEQLSQLLDGEASALEQADLFAHLGVCADCRDWFDTVGTVRRAARRDRELIADDADDLTPPLPARSGSRHLDTRRVRAWRLPVPLAAALAFALLTAGALLGARSSLLTGPLGAQRGGERVVVICSLPEVTVLPQGVAP